MKYYLAVDIGASSGRHIIGYSENGQVVLKEVYRFFNGMDKQDGHLVWNIDRLFTEVKNGIKIALQQYTVIQSMAIDTWGVDYVLLNGDSEILPCYAYRDSRMNSVIDEVHSIVPFKDIYSVSGIEFHEFNSIYQLYADSKAGRLDNATDFLMIPEYLSYKLTGVKKKEYTNATTTAMLNTITHKFDNQLIERLSLNKDLFKDVCQPGESFGYFTKQVQDEVGGNIRVVTCASHDTASAVCGIDMSENAPYISSGTWSLLGVKSQTAITDKGENISNEGGVNNTFRYQKNIMGMWLINELKKNLDNEMSFDEMVSTARLSNYTATFDVNDFSLIAPDNMKNAIINLLQKGGNPTPNSEGDIINSVYHSLAKGYSQTFNEICENTGKKYNKLYIVGGGAKNKYLNELTATYTNVQVVAFPIEATSLGNIKIQMEADCL